MALKLESAAVPDAYAVLAELHISRKPATRPQVHLLLHAHPDAEWSAAGRCPIGHERESLAGVEAAEWLADPEVGAALDVLLTRAYRIIKARRPDSQDA